MGKCLNLHPSSSSWGHSLKPYVAYFIPVLSVLSHLITTQQHPRCWNVSQRYIGFIRCGRPRRNLYAEFSSQNLGESGASSGMGFSIQKFLTKAFLTHRICIPRDSSYLPPLVINKKQVSNYWSRQFKFRVLVPPSWIVS